MASVRGYQAIAAATLREGDREATLWAIECAVRRKHARVDGSVLANALRGMEEAGRIERVPDSPKAAYRFRPGRR